MPKLTDSQLIVLSKGAARDDGAAVTPQGMGKAPAAKVGSSLVARNSCGRFDRSRGCRSGVKWMERTSAS